MHFSEKRTLPDVIITSNTVIFTINSSLKAAMSGIIITYNVVRQTL